MSEDDRETTNTSVSIERAALGGEIERRNEVAATAIATAARAEIEARYVVALRRPRSLADLRVKLLTECERPGFAFRAFYSVERWGAKPGRLTGTPNVVEGLSVRFAEAAIRLMGNVLQSTITTYDDDFKRMVKVMATDLETNAVYSRDVVIEKTQERRELKKNQVAIAQRTNSAGQTVYLVATTEADLLAKEGGLVSRVFRTLALRFVPADILEECEKAIVKTIRTQDAKDPDAARKAIADGFADLGIMPSDLRVFTGLDLEQCSPAQITQLRGLYGAIKDGEVTWAEVLAEKNAGAIDTEGKPAESKPAASKVAEKIEANRRKREAKKPPAPTPSATDKPANDGAPTPGLVCLVCKKPCNDGVSTTSPDGEVGIRHDACKWPEGR